MKRLLAAIVAGMFALAVTSPVIAQDKKKEQVHKGTPEQGTVQKKDQKKAKTATTKKAPAKSTEKKAPAKSTEKKAKAATTKKPEEKK
jgi:hypothetical protein